MPLRTVDDPLPRIGLVLVGHTDRLPVRGRSTDPAASARHARATSRSAGDTEPRPRPAGPADVRSPPPFVAAGGRRKSPAITIRFPAGLRANRADGRATIPDSPTTATPTRSRSRHTCAAMAAAAPSTRHFGHSPSTPSSAFRRRPPGSPAARRMRSPRDGGGERAARPESFGRPTARTTTMAR
ncbi:hypothetical protein [Streptomyces sp. CAI-85]|uniref:hypothetical protein n=1 Tax=Streptomyces sp. CAI-85 TaxID=1472662 RepID=UPI0015872110|nr:hypothetical protein [Streptomyces sp. CAI-85]NUV64821.1 hypothetical protein [Streptomyces sp. CAI-85]